MRDWNKKPVDWSTTMLTAQETRTRIQLADRDTTPVFYVSMRGADRYALLIGPFADESICRQYAYSESEDGGNPALSRAVRQLAYEIDPKSHFYGFGMARTPSARRTGIFHNMVGHGELETKLQNRGGTIPRQHGQPPIVDSKTNNHIENNEVKHGQ